MREKIYNEDLIVFFEVFDSTEARVHGVPCQNKEQVIELKRMLKKLVKVQGVEKTEKNIFLKEERRGVE